MAIIVNDRLKLSENARRVLEKRYFKKDDDGKVLEDASKMFERVANAIAEADLLYDNSADIEKTAQDFFQIMSNLEFLPNSPTLMNAGKDLGQLSACFVLPIEDSMESIFETLKYTALIHKSGGGTGFDFSRLRPKNSVVKTTGGVASGPVSFMKAFDAATQAVKQGGTRRGANMGILRVDHPDILEFITCKENSKDITNFNISIALTEEFMQMVEDDKEYQLIDPHTKMGVSKLKARYVFDLIVNMAHKNGEPGIIFLDRLNRYNPTPLQGAIESTNPCGEQPLLPYESCNLGSINLSKMVKDGEIDWDKLRKVIQVSVHFLDNVIDVNKFPLLQIEEMTKRNRKIGLGVMGFADMLIQINTPYNSDEALQIAKEIMSFILKEAQHASSELAKQRGVPEGFKGSIYDDSSRPILRNITLTTIAPTGTLSIIANCSSGIEPLFAIAYYRKVLDNEKLTEVNPFFEQIAKEAGFYSKELFDEIAEKGTLRDIQDIPHELKRVFVTAHDITPEWHVKMQSAFQEFTHNAVSKTINFPHTATIDDIKKAYLLAYRLGCKGITIYRDRSRDTQVLNIDNTITNDKNQETTKKSPRPRSRITYGTTTKITTGCGNLYVTINNDEDGLPFEIFTQMGKAGGCAASQLEAIGRLVSLALRSGINIAPIIEQLEGIRCPSPGWEKDGKIFSCSDAIAKVIDQRLQKNKQRITNIVGVCPDCGDALRHVDGCMVCRGCGYSKC